jgi:predicted nucleic acid-binding protein
MSYLVDTNVFAAILGDRPNAAVASWIAENESELYTSSITIAEISFGVEQLQSGRKRMNLQTALDELIRVMGDRILRFDTRVALVWGKTAA